MEIKYLGHSSFRLKGKNGTVVTDPFDSKMVGLNYPSGVSAEIVTVSHQHGDHNQVDRVKGTANRAEPLVLDQPGEYEANGISVFGVSSWHDNEKGAKRGENVIFVFQIDGVTIAHLGDLGHELSKEKIEEIGPVDVVLIPVGGEFTIGPEEAKKVILELSPGIVVPMHYKAPGMTAEFDGLATVDQFLEKAGFEKVRREDKLKVDSSSLPEDTEVVVLSV